MAPPRRPLGPISPNRVAKKELSPYKRGQIVGAKLAGARIDELVESFHAPEGTIKTTLRQAKFRHNGVSLPRLGRPKSWTERDVRSLIRIVRQYPKYSYAQVKKELRRNWSTATIKRILEPSGITNWRAKRRPVLSEDVAAKRLA